MAGGYSAGRPNGPDGIHRRCRQRGNDGARVVQDRRGSGRNVRDDEAVIAMALFDTNISVADTGPIVATERLLWAAPLTVATSIVAVHIVRLLAVRVPGILADATPLRWIAPTVDTVILV